MPLKGYYHRYIFQERQSSMEGKTARNILKEVVKLGFWGMCIYGATDYSAPKEYIDKVNSVTGGRFLYLTNLALYLTILAVLFGYLVKVGGLRRLECFYKDLLALAFSVEGIVTSLYWALIAIDPVLVKDRELYERGIKISLAKDLSQHVIPFLTLLIDQVDTRLRRKNQCVYLVLGFCAVYFLHIWFFSTKNGDKWVYPILNKMTMPYRIMFVMLGAFIGVIFYLGLIGMNSLTHGKESFRE